MKTIEYYMNLPYRLELVPDTDEGGFVASYPELRGCLTSGETAEAALKNALDCKRCTAPLRKTPSARVSA